MLDFKEKMDKILAEKNKEKRERSGLFNPSSFGRCFRLQILNRLDIPKSNPVDERTLRVFAVGNMLEKYIVDLLGITDFTQIETREDDILGFADYVDDDAVYDIKSQHSFAFHYMEKDGYDIKVEKKHNILQVIYYAMMLGKDKGVLVFFSKDDLCIYQHPFLVKEWANEVEDELAELRGHWEYKTLPKAQYRAFGVDKKTGKSKSCDKYCPWRDMCKTLPQEECSIEVLDIPRCKM